MIAPLLALVVARLVAAPEAGAFQLLRTDEAPIADRKQGDRILIPCNDVDRRLESDLNTSS